MSTNGIGSTLDTVNGGEVRYATPADVMAIMAEEPLMENYIDPDSGLMYRIEGMRKPHYKIDTARRAAELVARIKSGEVTVRDSTGEVFRPQDPYVAMAAFAARCVTQPKLDEMQWLATLDGTDILPRLFVRILICNRDLPEPEQNDTADSSIDQGL